MFLDVYEGSFSLFEQKHYVTNTYKLMTYIFSSIFSLGFGVDLLCINCQFMLYSLLACACNKVCHIGQVIPDCCRYGYSTGLLLVPLSLCNFGAITLCSENLS